MTCYNPLQGFRARNPETSGKFKIVFNRAHGYVDLPMQVPCGQCIGCRLERSRQWAVRCSHEASLHASNCFITLTYRDADLPRDGSLDVTVFQKFMKRLRKKYGEGIRFYHCGEYGSQFGRPHYHACIFGFDFPDKYLWKQTDRGDRLFRSPSLEELWPYGHSSIGDVTFQSAAYVARYITKKVTGDQAEKHYTRFNTVTGEIYQLKPEYCTMSRRPGIGRGWFEKFKTDVFPNDYVVMRGKKMRPPKYYDTLFELSDPADFVKIKHIRKRDAKKHVDDQTPERLQVRETVQLSKLKQLHRSIDHET